MKLALVKGTTGARFQVFVADSTSTVGAGKTGLTYNSSGLVACYSRPGSAPVAITLVTQTVTGAYSSGGFCEVDSTNMPGLYRLDLPDAALATGVDSVVVSLKGASGMAPVLLEVQLTDMNLHDATAGGISRLDAAVTTRAAASTAVSNADLTPTRAAKLDNLDTTVTSRHASGAAVASVSGAVGSVTSAVTVGANNDKTGYSLTTAPPTASDIAAAVWSATGRTLSSFGTLVTDVASGVWAAASRTLSAFGFTVTADSVTDKEGYSLATAPPTAADIVAAVLAGTVTFADDSTSTVEECFAAARTQGAGDWGLSGATLTMKAPGGGTQYVFGLTLDESGNPTARALQ